MVQTILAKLKVALTGPFAIAIGMLLLVAVGGGIGYLVANQMIKAEEVKKAELKAAEEAAKRGPPKPQRVPLGEEGPSPFEPRYITLGDEFISNLPQRGRALIVEVGLVTMKGEKGEKTLSDDRIPLRALTMAIISEMTVAQATAEDAQSKLAERLLKALNAEMRKKTGADLIDKIFIKRYYVQ
jgi:flagellar basal body-associated protein FliL